ncbi:MAG: site-2 protease family protein [Candidatus ainarchaeum sp.]|nr:site-2 protease family protein [Candidatus ainarchaeum sp.]
MKRLLGNNTSFKIDKKEAVEITICILAISLAVLIAINVHTEKDLFSDPITFSIFYLVFVFTIGLGFVLHELSHKAVAIAYGAQARFMMWPQGLLLMFITSMIGFVFAAPGAVYIFARNITKTQNGIISAAGPLMNMFLAITFVLFSAISPEGYFPVNIWLFGAYINSLLATFNLLPISPLDGSKVISWNFPIWVLLILTSIWMMMNFGGSLAL